ncbi:MAG: PucR family transcriptional regulator ligand-binding domain-containing protein, partial [Thermacetogeniaceae bacterium]
MGITVKEALDLIKLNGIKVGRVIAGFGGLDNIINSVSVIEVPNATRWYRGNELLITAFYSIKDNVKEQVQVIERIAQCKCAALVLCHTGIFLKEISQELIDAANYYKLPLIVVPDELAYIDIITPVLETIIDKQKREIEYAFN